MVIEQVNHRRPRTRGAAGTHIDHARQSGQFGSERRRLRVIKYRGRAYRAGYHDFLIVRGGLQVFPRLVASEHRQVRVQERLPSGLAALDALLGGGIDAGTSMLIVGAAGVDMPIILRPWERIDFPPE